MIGLSVHFTANGQENQVVTDQRELVLGIPDISEKTLPVLQQAILEMKGCEFVRYCEAHQLVLLRFNPETYSSPDILIKALREKMPSLNILPKEGSFADIQDLCY